MKDSTTQAVDSATPLFASVAAEWEDRPHRLPEVIEQVEAPRRDHSEKPDLFMDLVEQMSPGPRLEMFARTPRLGWASWGNESLCHVDLSSESQREAAESADEKPDGQAENA